MIARSLLLLCLAMSGAVAQRPAAPRRGFEPTIALSLERRYFGGRQEAYGTATASYDAPFGFDGLVQWPISRRTAAELEVAYHPDTRQRTEEGTDVRISGFSLKHTVVRGALAWRLKPFVPVYLFGGGGVAYATRYAYQGLRGRVKEPELIFGFGIDPRTHERAGLRIRYSGFVVFPAASNVPDVIGRGPTYDWAWQVGIRLPLVRRLPAVRPDGPGA